MGADRSIPPAERALEELAAGALRGPEGRAFRLFETAWPALAPRVAAFLGSLGVRRDSAEDCGQAALLRVWRFRRSYRGASAPELFAWMYAIFRNEAARAAGGPSGPLPARGTAGDDQLEPEPTERVLEPDPTAGAAEARDDLRALEECLATLEEDLRRVVELLYGAAPMTEREAQAVLGISKSYVNVRRRQALEALARCLTGKGVE